jgi:hypothetical protein
MNANPLYVHALEKTIEQLQKQNEQLIREKLNLKPCPKKGVRISVTYEDKTVYTETFDTMRHTFWVLNNTAETLDNPETILQVIIEKIL